MLSQLIESLKAIVVGQSVEERRATARARCHLPVACHVGAMSLPGQLRDLSVAGLGIGLDVQVPRGKSVKVLPPRAFAEHSPVLGTVKWCRKAQRDWYHVGLDLHGKTRQTWIPVALKELGLDPSAPRQRRKLMRVPANLPVDLKLASGKTGRGRLLNLSVGGALIESGERLTRHAEMQLSIGPWNGMAAMRLVGTVVSSNSEGVSLRFNHVAEDQRKLLGKYLTGLVRSARG